MMSGILLFPVKTDLATFYKKRIGRIIIPLLFWSIALPIAFALYAYFIKSSPNGLISIEKYTVEGSAMDQNNNGIMMRTIRFL